MKIAECKLESVTPYSQSRFYRDEKLAGELAEDYEERTWRSRCHTTTNGQLFIPPMSFANSLKQAAGYLSINVPGKGQTKFTKHFESGVLVQDRLMLPVNKDTVQGEWLFVPSDGRRGGSKRVPKCFPLIPEWSGVVNYLVIDDIITEEVFRRVLDTSGLLIGVGRFRPRNWGYYGQFKCSDINWIAD